MRVCVALLLSIGFIGCGSHVKLKEPPVNVTGKVSQSGQPLSGMMVVFQPLGDGHVREFPLRPDGTFNGELIRGEYAYYVTKGAVAAAAQKPITLSSKYFEADLSRTVTVEPDKLLAITLD